MSAYRESSVRMHGTVMRYSSLTMLAATVTQRLARTGRESKEKWKVSRGRSLNEHLTRRGTSEKQMLRIDRSTSTIRCATPPRACHQHINKTCHQSLKPASSSGPCSRQAFPQPKCSEYESSLITLVSGNGWRSARSKSRRATVTSFTRSPRRASYDAAPSQRQNVTRAMNSKHAKENPHQHKKNQSHRVQKHLELSQANKSS
jgi:hypothetical protein